MPAAPSSGVDQLKEERQRYVAAAELDAVEDQDADCWDLSSEDQCASAPAQMRDFSSSHPVPASGGLAISPAELQADVDKHDILSCQNELPQHAMLAAGVKRILQQHSMVRKCKRQSVTWSTHITYTSNRNIIMFSGISGQDA